MLRAAVLVMIVSLLPAFNAMSQPEVWLLSGPDCNVCDLFDDVRKHRGYGDTVTVNNQTYPIRNIDKAALPVFLERALGNATQSAHWPLQLTVAIVDNQTMLYQGNIAQSADFTVAAIKTDYMMPKATVTLDELHHYGFDYLSFFREQFNLEYFVDVALNNRAPRKDNVLSIPLLNDFQGKHSTVSLWGSAMQPAANGWFIATRINQLAKTFAAQKPVVIFGHGAKVNALDTLVLKDDTYQFVNAPVAADYSAGLDGVQQWFSAVNQSPKSNHLIIQVGHSGPNGSPLWGHVLPVNKSLLKQTVDETGKDTIMVSGACHGGLFAGAASCGFYAAHPEVIATGCQTSLSAIETSDDYLKFFFASDSQRDLNGDNQVSFREAHWFASSQLEHHNISYTDTDAVIDDYFDQHPEQLPQTISLKALNELAQYLSAEERYGLNQLSQGLGESTQIHLSNYVDKHKTAIAALQGKTELSSAQRNRITALAYPLNLAVLARRALYKRDNAVANTLSNSELDSCETRLIAEFVQ